MSWELLPIEGGQPSWVRHRGWVQRCGDIRVILHDLVMDGVEIVILGGSSGNDVSAEVEFASSLSEDGAVSWQKLGRIKDDSIKLEEGVALDVLFGASSLGISLDDSELGGQFGWGSIGANKASSIVNLSLVIGSNRAGDSPDSLLFDEFGILDGGILGQESSSSLGSLGDLLVHHDSLDGNHETFVSEIELLSRVSNEGISLGGDETSRVREAALLLSNDLLQNSHSSQMLLSGP